MIDLLPSHFKIIQVILKKHLSGIEVWAFGSRVNGTSRKTSDLDLVIVGQYKIESRLMGEIKYDFEESSLPFRVDVIDWYATSESFRDIICKHYEVIQKSTKKPLFK